MFCWVPRGLSCTSAAAGGEDSGGAQVWDPSVQRGAQNVFWRGTTEKEIFYFLYFFFSLVFLLLGEGAPHAKLNQR